MSTLTRREFLGRSATLGFDLAHDRFEDAAGDRVTSVPESLSRGGQIGA